ncbi:MAG TPA: branched-chain amino acid ABC transporter ATP-binding protein/permease [Jiangellaceae bacterium]|nr:branched-chain amino acid ABC transporter ATP-binding protein/permease [Jiangellaceae bacterium]
MIPRGLAGFGLGFVALASLVFIREPIGLPVFYLVLASTILFWTSQATSWNILSGFSGYFSFGQGAFVGLGAYTAAVLAGRRGVDFFIALPIAAVLGMILAALVGLVAFRLRSFRGEIFALLTLAVPFILASVARVNSAVDGGQGVLVPVPSFPDQIGGFQDFLYLLNLTVATVAVATAYAIQHSRFGWALASIRDAEEVAEGLGVPIFRYKMQAIVVTGVIGTVSGCIFALQIGFVTVESVFGLTIPLFVIVMSVLGGRHHWLGPVIGAVLIVTMQDRLSSAGFEGWNLVILGTILAVLVVVAPEGLQARLQARWRAALAAFVVVTGGSAALQIWGGVLDWVVAGMLLAAAVALAPLPRRKRGREAVPVGGRAAGAEPAAEPEPESTPEPEPAAQPNPDLADHLGTTPRAPAQNGSVIIECREVTRYFGGVKALQDVSLEIREGELVGLVGPNGSGKTTLVNLLSGAFRPTRGAINVSGHDVVDLPPHRIAHVGVARTYQIPRPFESMTVRDNVAMAIMFGREPRPLAQARRDAERHLEFVGLAHRAHARPAGINLHERQLLEMARAMATSPKVLLLDEALAGLNPAEIDQAVQVVRRIHESGITIVIVEHLLRVVNQLATRIVVLDRGSLLADGPPQSVMRDPAVVSAYLGKQAHA